MSMFSNGLKFALVASATAALMACGGGSTTEPANKVATTDASVNVGTANGPAVAATLSGETFSFPSGIAGFGTTAATTLKITAGSPATFEMKSGADTATGNLTFGSCTLTIVTRSGFTTSPATISDDACNILISIRGVVANGTASNRTVTWTLGGSRGTVTVPVTVNQDGTVLVKGGTLGTTPTVVPTGAGG
jgi:hypothetical protein